MRLVGEVRCLVRDAGECRMDDSAFSNDLFRALPQGEALRRYVEHGYPTNHFLRAVLENDLMEALARADDANFEALEAYCAWLKSHAPSACYGSPEKVSAWIEARGLGVDAPHDVAKG
jgi:hypothetical protein